MGGQKETMSKKEDLEKLKRLRDYYKNQGLAIIGFNDSQGVNTTSTIFKKGLLEYLASSLTDKDLNPTVINAFSLLMNKTEHIDYFLKNNLSLDEIKQSQVYGAISALEKVMVDDHLPKFLGKIGSIYKLAYLSKEGDYKIHITDTLKDSTEPTVIYSSGVNNLMRDVGNNPSQITKDYKRRDQMPNYDYTLEKVSDSRTLSGVISGIEDNFKTILSLNGQADIYALGCYVPKSLEGKGMEPFQRLVSDYNLQLGKLCSDYHITYINTELIGNKYNHSSLNFHMSAAGHNILANHILWQMYEKKIENPNKKSHIILRNNPLEISNRGAMGVSDDTMMDYQRSLELADTMDGYDRIRQLQIADEHFRESKVMEKAAQIALERSNESKTFEKVMKK